MEGDVCACLGIGQGVMVMLNVKAAICSDRLQLVVG